MLNVKLVTEQYNDLCFVFVFLICFFFFFKLPLDSLTNFLMGDVGNDSLLRLPVSQESKVGQVCMKAKTLIFLASYFNNILILISALVFDSFLM